MNTSDFPEFLMRFDGFFDVLKLSEAGLEKKRQLLSNAGVIEVVMGEECISPRKCAKPVLDELDSLHTKVMASRSYDDLWEYACNAIDYFRVWFCFLACIGKPVEPMADDSHNTDYRSGLNDIMDDCHRIYEHLYAAISLIIELNVSSGIENSDSKDRTTEDEYCGAFTTPLDIFTQMVKLSGSELEEKHRDLEKEGVIVEFGGVKHVLHSRYISFLLDDLEYLRLRVETLRAEKAIEDYAFFSEAYLEIWVRILLAERHFKSLSGNKVSEAEIRNAYENDLNSLKAIYRYAHNAIVISLENGGLAVSQE